MGTLLGEYFKPYGDSVEKINQAGADHFQYYDELAVEHKIRQLLGAGVPKEKILWSKFSQSYFVFVRK